MHILLTLAEFEADKLAHSLVEVLGHLVLTGLRAWQQLNAHFGAVKRWFGNPIFV